jgi:hypothetical protein
VDALWTLEIGAGFACEGFGGGGGGGLGVLGVCLHPGTVRTGLAMGWV